MGKLYPKSSAARVFFGPREGLPATAWTDSTLPGRQRLVDLPENCTAIVSFKDQAADRAVFVEAWLKYRPDVDMDLITHHEPEQQTGGDPTPVQYRASWTRTREQVGDHPARAAGRLRLATCWTLQWIRRGGDWRQWWPEHEADAVDVLLFDWYPFMASEPNPWKPRVYEDPAAALKVPTTIAAELGKPWGIAEIDHPRILRANGFTVDLDPDGALCAAWYRQMHAAAKVAGCQVWAHFHQNAGAAVGDLTTRPAEQQALRELIEQEATDVGRQRRLAWISKGSPFRLMQPAADLRDVLHAHGYTVYDIGNEDHLEHDPPEDHTPYSATGYPGEAQYGVGYAEDVMPPKPGQVSKVDGLPLPSLQQLGAQLLADRKAGVPGIKWLKYMNWEPQEDNGGPCFKEAWRPTYQRTSSTDRGHIHLSGLTGYETSTTGAGYDPVARIRGEDEDMPSADEIVAALLAADLNYSSSGSKNLPLRTLLRNLHQQGHGPSFTDWQATKETAQIKAQLAAITTALAKLPGLIGEEGTSPTELAAALAALPKPEPVDVDQVASAVAERVLAALPDSDTGPVSREDLEAALRSALGSLDGATPQS